MEPAFDETLETGRRPKVAWNFRYDPPKNKKTRIDRTTERVAHAPTVSRQARQFEEHTGN